jgi:hypothetical protein
MRAGGDERHQSISKAQPSIRWQEGGISSMTEDPPKEHTS